MIKNILKQLRKNKNKNIILLGRWNTINKNSNDNLKLNSNIEKNIFWANHDHCGSELCKIPNLCHKNN